MTAAARAPVPAHRRALMGKVHIARKELALDEPTYRAALERITGKTSAGLLSDAQLVLVLDDFKAKGWKPATATHRPRQADHAVAKKARALWISLHQLGAVRDASERALEGFARRQLKVTQLQWADQSQGFRLIEALKAMALRQGWDPTGEDVRALKLALVRRQWAILNERGAVKDGGPPGYRGLGMWVLRKGAIPCLKSENTWTEAELEAAADHLGRWIRALT